MVLPPIALGGNYGPSNSVCSFFCLVFMYMVFGRDSKYPHIELCPEHVSLVFLHRGGVWFIFSISRFSATSSSVRSMSLLSSCTGAGCGLYLAFRVFQPHRALSRAFFPCLLAHIFRPYQALIIYLTTLANSTLNIIIFKNVKICRNYFFQIKKHCQGK